MTLPTPVAFIYLIRNIENGMVYVGATKVDLNVRFKEHVKHPANKLMKRDLIVFGEKSFKIELIENVYNLEEVKEIENYWIEKLGREHELYNLMNSGYSEQVNVTYFDPVEILKSALNLLKARVKK